MGEFWNSIAFWFRSKPELKKNRILYKFEAPLLGYMRSNPAVIKGERDWVEQFIPIAEFEKLFGGYITWRPSDEIDETIGVWGRRNVKRFQRILKERGAEFDVVDNEGPKQSPWVATTHGYTRTARRTMRSQNTQTKY